MVERRHLDDIGLTEGVKENFLTYDEVFGLLKPYARLPCEGDGVCEPYKSNSREPMLKLSYEAFPKVRQLLQPTDFFDEKNEESYIEHYIYTAFPSALAPLEDVR